MNEHVHREYNPTFVSCWTWLKVGKEGSCKEVSTTLGYGLVARKVLDLGKKMKWAMRIELLWLRLPLVSGTETTTWKKTW